MLNQSNFEPRQPAQTPTVADQLREAALDTPQIINDHTEAGLDEIRDSQLREPLPLYAYESNPSWLDAPEWYPASRPLTLNDLSDSFVYTDEAHDSLHSSDGRSSWISDCSTRLENDETHVFDHLSDSTLLRDGWDGSMHSSDNGSRCFDDTDDEYVQVSSRDLFERLGTRIGPVRDAAIAARLRILQQAINEERFWDENEELTY
jgi:hypothetical protein